jgi:hypothetical protein
MTRRLQFSRGDSSPSAVLFLGLVLFLCTIPPRPAQACWNTVLLECFDVVPTIPWPWQHPANSGRWWQRVPSGGTTWGFEQDVYSTTMCPDNTQALWCIGNPPSNDPEFDNYPPNYDAYVTYGPMDLSAASAARVTFYLYDRCEAGHDSFYWGAATTSTLTLQAMNLSGSHSGIMLADWEERTMDLSRLHNVATGDSTSMLGQPQVWVFWRFSSDNNTVVNRGAFFDNISIAWDDGGVDVWAQAPALINPDSDVVDSPQVGDVLTGAFDWGTCSGGSGTYSPFRIMALADTQIVLDTTIADPHEGMAGRFYTQSWTVTHWGPHVFRVKADTLDQVAETNEANNALAIAYNVPMPNYPPEFIWITPGAEPVYADTAVMLRWEAYDSLEVAYLTFLYVSGDTSGCEGNPVPGGNRTENDGPDSLVWNTRFMPDGWVYHVMVRVTDAANDTCIYAPSPVIIRHAGVNDDHRMDGIPRQFYLGQNFPNPFNPVTELHYGMAMAGHVKLTVWDVLGREVAVLVDGVRSPGHYVVEFDGTNLPAGLYFYSLTVPEGTQSRRMMLLK